MRRATCSSQAALALAGPILPGPILPGVILPGVILPGVMLAGVMLAGVILPSGVGHAQELRGEYTILVKAGKDRGLKVNPKNLILTVQPRTANEVWTDVFQIVPAGGGDYQIKANGINLHEDGSQDKLLSIRWAVSDDYTRFKLEKQSDGTYKIKTKATGRYWHVDGNGDKLVSTRYQPNDDFVKFEIRKYETPVSLFQEQYATIKGLAWKSAKSLDNAKHEATFTINHATPINMTMNVVGTAESEKFGSTVRLLGKEKAPQLRDFRLILEDQRAQQDQKNQARVLMGHVGHIDKRNGQTIVLLQDLTQFQNEAYTKTDHFVGPYLESVKVTYGGVPGWGYPSISPLSQNKTGSYNQSTTIGADLSVGFQGKTPAGSLGGSLSQTTGSSTDVPDIIFTQTTRNSAPEFTWTMGNCYPSNNEVQSYENNPWNAVRKVAFQVAIDRSVHDAAPLSRGTFQIATHCAYTLGRASNLPDFQVRLDYEVTYRSVFTDPQKWKSDAEAFGRGVGFVFGLDPNMWSGQTFRTWGTVKTVHKFPVVITIPASLLNQ